MKSLPTILALAASAGLASAVTIEVGVAGFAPDTNNWPDGEAPRFAIDGFGQKYLNFGKENTGVIVTPALGATTAIGITLWSANDEEPRDPASYQLFGTNDVLGGGPFDSSQFTLISAGATSLPASRNNGGVAEPLLPANSWSEAFANTDAYTSYMILFPTLKDSGNANSMQIAEIQLNGAAGPLFSPNDAILGVEAVETIPEPSAGLLALLATAPLLLRRRRK